MIQNGIKYANGNKKTKGSETKKKTRQQDLFYNGEYSYNEVQESYPIRKVPFRGTIERWCNLLEEGKVAVQKHTDCGATFVFDADKEWEEARKDKQTAFAYIESKDPFKGLSYSDYLNLEAKEA